MQRDEPVLNMTALDQYLYVCVCFVIWCEIKTCIFPTTEKSARIGQNFRFW